MPKKVGEGLQANLKNRKIGVYSLKRPNKEGHL
jgi:hypothetical protein